MNKKSKLKVRHARLPRVFGGQGFTLVEVMVAIVILMVMALGSAAFLYHSQVGISTQGNKRVALEAASSRLEEIRASQYDSIKPPANNYNVYYLSGQAGDWTLAENDPGETRNINGKTLPIVTKVRYMDINGGPDSYDYVQITVSTGYRTDINDMVTLETFRFP
jgi:prepilin-type N-terminal cleavage/methylation domain-containing protein